MHCMTACFGMQVQLEGYDISFSHKSLPAKASNELKWYTLAHPLRRQLKSEPVRLAFLQSEPSGQRLAQPC